MASIKPVKTGYRAQVYVKGQRDSATFDTKAQAEAWADKREKEMREVQAEPAKGYTFGELLGKYAEEVSPTKRGAKWEQIRLAAIQRDLIAAIRLSDLKPNHIADWRDRRLRSVKGSSVAREMTLIKHVLEVARRDWAIIQDSPAKDVRKPPSQPHRERIITDKESELICAALGYEWPRNPVTVQHRVALAFLFALETAMRSGEICSLKRSDISGKVAHLRQTKNGTARKVPLSPRALEILELLDDDLFNLSDKSRDATFRQAVKRSGVDGVTFHDTRHTAIVALAKKIPVLDLARMTGHKDLKMLLIYYNEPMENIADRL